MLFIRRSSVGVEMPGRWKCSWKGRDTGGELKFIAHDVYFFNIVKSKNIIVCHIPEESFCNNH